MSDKDIGRDPNTSARVASHLNVVSAFRSEKSEPQQAGKEKSKTTSAIFAGGVALDLLEGKAGIGTAFIGGGCCVHLSVEYMAPANATNSTLVTLVQDSENTMLGWGKSDVKPGYYIKEGIITTHPGAELSVVVLNMTARLRWCEVFSC